MYTIVSMTRASGIHVYSLIPKRTELWDMGMRLGAAVLLCPQGPSAGLDFVRQRP